MSDTRLLSLLSLLQTPREWPGSELAERLGVTARTIRRDVERLRGLGYPVAASMGADGGYRLAAGQAMPPLLLDDEEAVAIAVALRVSAGQAVGGIGEASVRAFAKLSQVLPARLKRRVTTVAEATTPLFTGTPAVDPEHLAVIAGAIANRETLRMRYRDRDGTDSARLVEPHRLVPTLRQWYLVAFDRDRDDWRVFRVDRVGAPTATGGRVPTRELPDAAAYVAERIADPNPTHAATILVHAPLAEVRRRVGAAPVGLEAVGEDLCRLRMPEDTLRGLVSHLLMLDRDFTVEDPPELAEHVRTLGRRLTAAAG